MEPSDIVFDWNDSFSNPGVSDAYITHKGMPKISQNPDKVSKIKEGDEWEWQLRIKGLKPITVELYQDDNLRAETTYDGEMTMFTIVIGEVSASDEGDYELIVTNEKSTVYIKHELKVI